MIHFPRERVIHTGDLFLNFRAQRAGSSARPPGAPIYVDSAQGGFIEWSRTLNARWRWTSTR